MLYIISKMDIWTGEIRSVIWNKKYPSIDGNEWTPEQRFSVALENTTLSEMELTDSSQRMQVFIERVKEWWSLFIQAQKMKITESRRADKELREARIRLRELEKEFIRKDKTLSEDYCSDQQDCHFRLWACTSIGIKTPKRLKKHHKRMFLQHHFCAIWTELTIKLDGSDWFRVWMAVFCSVSLKMDATSPLRLSAAPPHPASGSCIRTSSARR